jgi:flap endonuclease-1
MSDLTGKNSVIDASIYMYKYESNDTLMENIYLMLSIFRHYNIIPIFVFDGKPPNEKHDLLKKRRENKIIAESKYNELKEQLNDDDDMNEVIIDKMTLLKKQFVYLTRDKINKVKELIIAYGACYHEAEGEADEICASMVINKKAWACMSDDMDMFVYGCTRVIRYFGLSSHSAILYYTKGILQDLDMTQTDFKQVCVISGTDYNSYLDDKIALNESVKKFKQFKEETNKEKNNNIIISNQNYPFYNWLQTNKLYDDNEMSILYNIIKMFDIKKDKDACKNIKIINGQINKEKMRELMREEGFIFVDC